jgi:hypothetical protein
MQNKQTIPGCTGAQQYLVRFRAKTNTPGATLHIANTTCVIKSTSYRWYTVIMPASALGAFRIGTDTAGSAATFVVDQITVQEIVVAGKRNAGLVKKSDGSYETNNFSDVARYISARDLTLGSYGSEIPLISANCGGLETVAQELVDAINEVHFEVAGGSSVDQVARDAAAAAQGTANTAVSNAATAQSAANAAQTTANAAIPKSLLDAKGDLIAGSADDTAVRIAVGTNGQILEADSTKAAGVKWATNLAILKSLIDAKGDLLAGSADNTVVRIAVGSNGQILEADSTQAAGVKWADNLALLKTLIDAKGDLIVGSADNTGAKLSVGSNGQILEADSTQATGMKWADKPASGGTPVAEAIFTHQTNTNGDGGDFSSGAWRTRTLNTTVYSSGSGISRTGNVLTLAAGTYEVFDSFAVGTFCDKHICRLRQTDGTAVTLIVGSAANAESNTASKDNIPSSLSGRFTLAAQQTVELQHRCETTRTTDGWGWGGSNDLGEVNIFARLRIKKWS